MSARLVVRTRKNGKKSYGVIVVDVYRKIDQRWRDLRKWAELRNFKRMVDQLVRRARPIVFHLREARECWLGRSPGRHFSMRRHLCEAQKLLHGFKHSPLTARERVIQACVTVATLRQELESLTKACDELAREWEEGDQAYHISARRCGRRMRALLRHTL